MEDLPNGWKEGKEIGKESCGDNYTKFFYNDEKNLELKIKEKTGGDYSVLLWDVEADESVDLKLGANIKIAEKHAIQLMKEHAKVKRYWIKINDFTHIVDAKYKEEAMVKASKEDTRMRNPVGTPQTDLREIKRDIKELKNMVKRLNKSVGEE